MNARIYLDNAATSWPKPESVYVAMDQYQRQQGVAAGRGGYVLAETIDRKIQQTRLQIAKLLGSSSPECVVFSMNCTDALNLALHGLLRPGDHVVTTTAEHNSILRPLEWLKTRGIITMTTVPTDAFGVVDLEELRTALKQDTRLLAMTHASNVTGTIQPVAEIGAMAYENDCLFLLDAAQTLGHVPIDVSSWNVDLLAAPGHKGLLGPLGTGVLYVADELHEHVDSVRQGGTGTQSEQPQQPAASPAKFESGNLNVPGIIGLEAGVRYVSEKDMPHSTKLRDLSAHLIDRLSSTSGVTLYSKANDCGIVSLNAPGFDPRELATLLDAMAGVQVRAGLHCAPLMHRTMGTFDHGGSVRISCGHFNSAEEMDLVCELLETLGSND